MTAATSVRAATRPVLRGLAWLAFLGPFFFLSYGYANWLSAERGDVGVVMFAWERHIPFIPWTIVPYWLIDVLYAASLLMFVARRALDIHALRLLTAQLIAVVCFIAFPLRFSFERPGGDGAYAVLFDVLASFDRPFNQAPSLHIALLVILWLAYFKRLPRGLHLPMHCVFLLIGVSVLTAWQHHFIDVPTGLWLGWLCVWLVPSHARSPIAESRLANDSRRQRIALRYGIAAAILLVIASVGGGVWLWSLWLGTSIALVTMIYLFGTERWFQKSTGGRLSRATSWLLWPYLEGAWINSGFGRAVCHGVLKCAMACSWDGCQALASIESIRSRRSWMSVPSCPARMAPRITFACPCLTSSHPRMTSSIVPPPRSNTREYTVAACMLRVGILAQRAGGRRVVDRDWPRTNTGSGGRPRTSCAPRGCDRRRVSRVPTRLA